MNTLKIAPNTSGSWGLTANQLKFIAIACMLIDHIAHVFVPWDTALATLMHFVGRVTGPIMFFMAAAGYHYTRNNNRYMARLAIFAIISYLPFLYCFTGHVVPADISDVLYLNVIYTIFLGVAAIRVRHSNMHNGFKAIIILGLYLLSSIGDWGTLCISIMLVFDLFQGDFKKQFWGYMAVIFLQGGLLDVINWPLYLLYGGTVDLSYLWSSISDFGMILPAILLSRYNGQKGTGGVVAKYSFYLFYPVHLIVLGLLRYFL